MKNVLKTSVTIINECMIFALPEEMSDEDIEHIKDLVVGQANEQEIRGVILNFSMVKVIDSYTYQAIYQISMALNLLGVEVVWARLQPGVIIAMLDLNIDINKINVHTSLTIENALVYLNEKNDDRTIT